MDGWDYFVSPIHTSPIYTSPIYTSPIHGAEKTSKIAYGRMHDGDHAWAVRRTYAPHRQQCLSPRERWRSSTSSTSTLILELVSLHHHHSRLAQPLQRPRRPEHYYITVFNMPGARPQNRRSTRQRRPTAKAESPPPNRTQGQKRKARSVSSVCIHTSWPKQPNRKRAPSSLHALKCSGRDS